MNQKYQINHSADNLSSRVFILQKSELEKRFDPSWYIYLQSIQGFKDKKVPLKTLLLENPQYGANEIGIERYSYTEPRYIRITDINDFGELENVLGKTASVIEEKYFLNDNDLLLARSGNTVGKSYLHKNVGYDCFFAGYMIRFKLDQAKVLPEYIFAYTQTEFYKKWTKAIQRTTGQPNINAEEYRSLEIPLPDKLTQNKIAKIYFDFIAQKQKNEAEADKLLSSIDDYLIKELGIKLPEPPENTLKNRMFVTKINSVSGNRFDPFFNQAYFIEVENAIKSSNFRTDILRNQLSFIESGSRPKGGATKDDEGILSLGGEHVNSYCEVEVRTAKYIPLEFHQSILATETKLNDILFVKDGATTGKVGMINKPDYARQNINEHVFLLRPIPEINPFYLVNYLNSNVAQIVIKKLIAGATVTGITKDALKSLPIPVPQLDKQKEIAEHITRIRQQAQALKDQTKELLKKANEDIEAILLN